MALYALMQPEDDWHMALTVACGALQTDQLSVAELRAVFNKELLQTACLQVWLDTFEAIRNMQLVSMHLSCCGMAQMFKDQHS